MKRIITLLALVVFLFSNTYTQTIAEIQGDSEDSPYLNEVVTTFGIVTAVHGDGYFIQDGTAVRSGIYVYDQSLVPAIGDSIRITAEVDEFYNLTELKNATTVEILSSNHTLPDPIVLTTDGIHDEDYEGMLIKVVEANCTDADIGFGESSLSAK